MSASIISNGSKSAKSGFTIIELSLSIAFIAILSIAVTLIIVNTISSYRRGITLNQLNTTGMDLVDDMRASVQGSATGSIVEECSRLYNNNTARIQCENDGAHNFIIVSRYDSVKVGGSSIGSVPVFGAFCSGNYSYIWNSGYYFGSGYNVNSLSSATFKYKQIGSNDVKTKSGFKLLKIKDETRSVCISAVLGNTANTSNPRYNVGSSGINNGGSVFDISGDKFNSIESEPIDILSNSSGGNLAIYDITSSTPAIGAVSTKLFYSVSFILGTVQGGINVASAGSYCTPPEGFNSDIENFDYCAINKFNFAAQTTGG